MSIKMIVTDLDNTLLRRDKTVSDYTISVLNKCREWGFLFAFATARPARVTERFSTVLQPDAIIADNGAVVIYKGAEISKMNIPEADANSLIAALIADKRTKCIGAECGHCQLTTYSDRPPITDVEAWNFVYSDFSSGVSFPATKISIECADGGWVEDILRGYPDLRLYSNIGEDWRQITMRNATKLNAIKTVRERLCISNDEIVAFGDDMNDIEMLRECGVGVAVANAIDEAKTAVDYVCDDCDCDGVAKWLEENIL